MLPKSQHDRAPRTFAAELLLLPAARGFMYKDPSPSSTAEKQTPAPPVVSSLSKNMSVLLPTSHGNHAYANHNLPGSTSPSSSAGSLDILDWLEPGRHPILPAPIPDTGPRGLYSADYRAAYTWSTTNRCEKPHLFYRVHPKPASPLLHGY